MSGRRGLTAAVVGVAFGAGLVLLGASRVWWRETVLQPAPLRSEEILHTGASLAPVLPALGFVALAGAGGLLATRGTARRLVGGLLVVAAIAMVALVIGRLGTPPWPLVCLAGGVLVGAGGGLAVRHGHRWPVMGSRYGRNAREPTEDAGVATADPGALAAADLASGAGTEEGTIDRSGRATDSAELWDALDRGDDPTRG